MLIETKSHWEIVFGEESLPIRKTGKPAGKQTISSQFIDAEKLIRCKKYLKLSFSFILETIDAKEFSEL